MFQIRTAIPQDAPYIATIKIKSWRDAYAHILRPETLANLDHPTETERFHKYIENQEHILVATNPQNQPIAYSLWIQLNSPQIQDPDQPKPNQGRVENPRPTLASTIKTDWPYPNMLASLYVLPNHYRQGIGTILVRENAKLSLYNHHKGMMIGVFHGNHRAKALYTKLGAEYIKTTTFTVDGNVYPDELLAFHNLERLVQS